MKIHLTGLPEQADADTLRERTSHFGPVEDVHVLREYRGDDPLSVVLLDAGRGTATKIAQRIDGIRFRQKSFPPAFRAILDSA
ncbi:MAG: RNA-binding protein [Thiobacillaceae bacterium]|nr:RNA-binding protein [Thiobacillaceae bacterium]